MSCVVHAQDVTKKASKKPKHKVKVAVISFTEDEKIEKIDQGEKAEISTEVKQAMNSHSFNENSLDSEILRTEDSLSSDVVYIQ